MNTQIAVQQPPTTGKIILYTSHGEINIELWTKQTPLASRNFIHHCLEGYYNNTSFHRLIPGFMIQGGDPTGTGLGGQSVYGQPFKDQFHQRLKFTRRGIVAMANAGKNDNKSQFFITFGPCQHLNKKHTIFGKVVGDTIYNLMSLQSLDTADQDKPLDPPIIRKIKVVENPFTDIQITKQQQNQNNTFEDQTQGQVKDQPNKNKQQKQTQQKKLDLKKLKKKNKLTFENDEDEQGDRNENTARIKSSHDVLYKKDTSLSNKISITKQELQKKRKQKQNQQKKAEEIKNALSLKQKAQKYEQHGQNTKINDLISRQLSKKRADFQRAGGIQHTSKDQQILNYEKRYNPETKKYEIVFKDQLDKQKAEHQKAEQMQRKAKAQQQITDQKLKQVRQMQLQEYSLLKADQLNFKRAKQGSLKQRRKQLIHQQKKLLSNLQKHRYEYVQKKKIEEHQGELFKKLLNFSNRLKTGGSFEETKKQGKQEDKNIFAADEQEQKGSSSTKKNTWMIHKLKFHIDSSNAFNLDEKVMRHNLNRMESNQGQEFNPDQNDGGLKMQVEYNNAQSSEDELQQLLKGSK